MRAPHLLRSPALGRVRRIPGSTRAFTFPELRDWLLQAGAGRGARAPSPGEREEAVLRHVARRGRGARREAAELAGIGPYQASRLLDRLVAEGKPVRRGERRDLLPCATTGTALPGTRVARAPEPSVHDQHHAGGS